MKIDGHQLHTTCTSLAKFQFQAFVDPKNLHSEITNSPSYPIISICCDRASSMPRK